MPGELMGRGKYLSLELIGIEHVDKSLEMMAQELDYSGLLVGLVVENHSNETCRWRQKALEFIDTSGFTYLEENSREVMLLDRVIPGGWHADLSDLKPNRKYRLLTFIKDFHGELGTISFEKEARRVVQTGKIGNGNQVEEMEIDVSHLSEDEIGGLPAIADAFAEHS